MNKVIKIMMIAIVLIMITVPVFAAPTTIDTGKWKDIYKLDDKAGGFNDLINTVLGVLLVASGGIAVITFVIMAVQMMISSPNEKAQIKTRLMPFVIGATIVFGASALIEIVAGIAMSAFYK